jgi:hypothetical protein
VSSYGRVPRTLNPVLANLVEAIVKVGYTYVSARLAGIGLYVCEDVAGGYAFERYALSTRLRQRLLPGKKTE